MAVVLGLCVIERNIKGGRTTKKAKRANVCPWSFVNQPILHEKLPKNIIIKKMCQIWLKNLQKPQKKIS